MTRYASTTSVPVEKTRYEIEHMLNRYGATAFGYQSRPGFATVVFACKERQIRFELPLPAITEKEFTHDKKGNRREGAAQHKFWEQACRARWRALLLCIRAKLEAVSAGIAQFEEEFFAYVVVPKTGETLYRAMQDQVKEIYLGNEKVQLRLTGPVNEA